MRYAGIAVVTSMAEAVVLVTIAVAAVALSGTSDEPTLPVIGPAPIAVVFFVAFGALIVRTVSGGLGARYGRRFVYRSTVRVQRHLLERYFASDWTLQSEARVGTLPFILTVVAPVTPNAVATVANTSGAAVGFVMTLGAAVGASPAAALAVGAFAALLAMVMRPLNAAGRSASTQAIHEGKVLGESLADVGAMFQEVKVAAASDAVVKTLGARSDRAAYETARKNYIGTIAGFLYQSFVYLALLLALAVVWVIADGSTEAVASAGVVALLLLRAMSYAQQLQSTYQSLNAILPNLATVRAELDRLDRSQDEYGSVQLQPEIASLLIDNVSYHYPTRSGTAAVGCVSFGVDAGAALAIVGRSGSGKSTLLQLMLRLRRPTTGSITLGGVAIADFSPCCWQSMVGFVPQQPRLLNATITENIAFFRDLTDERVVEAARLVGLHDEIVRMPHGYQTRVGDGGGSLSGGQRQRVAFARALAGRPTILFLDEATSALDRESAEVVLEAVRDLRGRVTMVIVAHSPEIVKLCSDIVVLSSGQPAYVGRIDEHAGVNEYLERLMEANDGGLR